MEAALLDWNALPEDLAADVVLLSDINYEPEAFDALLGSDPYVSWKKVPWFCWQRRSG
jgi:hypothetical protein